MKRILILTGLISSTFSFAQNDQDVAKEVVSEFKKLELAPSVMEQYRSFYPKGLTNFLWIPKSNKYSTFSARWDELQIKDIEGNVIESITLETINSALSSGLFYLQGFQWKNSEEFYLESKTAFYSYNIKTKSGKKLYDKAPQSENNSISSTGKGVYTLKNNIGVFTGKKLSNSTKFEDPNIVSGQAIARSEFGITNGIFWSPSGENIGFYQKDETAVHDYPLLDLNVTPGALKSIKYPMAGQTSEVPKVGVISTKSGKAKYLKTFGTEKDHYLTNFGWGPQEEFVYIAEVNRDQNHMNLLKYNAKNGKLEKVLFEEKNDKWVEPEHPVYFPNSTKNEFIWMSERDGFMNLYLYNTEGKLIKQLTKNKWVAQEILGTINGGKAIVFQGTGPNPLNTMIYSVDIETGLQTLLTKTPGTHRAQLSESGDYLYDSYSNHKTPRVDQIIDMKGSVVKELSRSENPLKEYQMGTADISSIKAKDGTTLHTRMIKPSKFDPTKKYPVLVYVYGGPHAQMVTNSWLDGASLWMYWMAEQGYIIYTVDNRGSGNRGFEFESVIHRNLGKYEMEDQLSGVDFLKSQNYVDSKRIAVHGWSFGGYMTTSLMLKQPGTYTTGVAGGPVTDWNYYEAMYGERYMDRPSQNKEGYKETNLSNHVKNLEGELLLIHGTVDPTVVPQHNYKLVQSFVDAGIQVDFFPYPMHEHNVRGKDRVHLIEKILTYVLEHNK